MTKGNPFTVVRDGLKNILSGRGTQIDKSAHSFWYFTPMAPDQVQAAYRASWLIRKIVDLPADDMIREGRIWALKPDQIKKIEEAEQRLRIEEELLEGLVFGRLGGGILVIGTDGDMAAEAKDGETLTYVKALPRQLIGIGPLEWEVDSENFGQPGWYEISGSRNQDRIHPSRIHVFHGERVPALHGGVSDEAFWGDSVVSVVDDAVKNVNTATGGFASLIDEAKIDVFKLAGLAETLMQPGGDAKVQQRVELANMAKSMWRAIFLDKEDDWQTRQINWSGMPDVMKTYLMVAAGAADIPATRLYGKAPDGQNSTGESDDRNYRSMIKTRQNRVLRPAWQKIDRFLLAELSIPVDSAWTFAPLTTPTEKEQAEIDKTRAETAKIYDDTGLIPREAFALGVQSQLIEADTYPQLAEELEKLPPADRIPDPEDNVEDPLGDPSAIRVPPKPGEQPKPGDRPRPKAVNDAAPRSLYVSRKVENAADIIRWAKAQGFTTTLTADEMHVTIIYSRQPIDWMDVESGWGDDDEGRMTIKAGGARLVEPLGDQGAVVLLFNSSELSWRHEAIKRAGAQHDYDYQPHVTLTYRKPEGLDLASVEPYRGPIKLGPEVFDEIVGEWSANPEEA